MAKILKESSVIIVQLKDSNKILILLRLDGWCLPGGKKDQGDKTSTDCAIRELEEETGIKIRLNDPTLRYLGNSIAVSGRKVSVFTVVVDNKKVRLSGEHSEYKWINLDSIGKVLLAGNTKNFIDLLN